MMRSRAGCSGRHGEGRQELLDAAPLAGDKTPADHLANEYESAVKLLCWQRARGGVSAVGLDMIAGTSQSRWEALGTARVRLWWAERPCDRAGSISAVAGAGLSRVRAGSGLQLGFGGAGSPWQVVESPDALGGKEP